MSRKINNIIFRQRVCCYKDTYLCTILKGVRIGDGAVIAAGTIVNKDVPARALAAGNPMHLICDNVEWTN